MSKAKPFNPVDHERILQIAAAAAEQIIKQIGEGEEQIRDDYAKTVEEAHLNEDEKLPKLKLNFVISFTPASRQTDFDLKWTVNRSISDSVVLDDPQQPKLDFEITGSRSK